MSVWTLGQLRRGGTERYEHVAVLLVVLIFTASTVHAVQPQFAMGPPPPVISIIIDDLGDRFKDGKRAVDIPAELTYSFLPHTPYAKQLAERAFENNKEIMLHLPMESVNQKALGPGGLTYAMTRANFENTVQSNLQAVPHVSGINNHMGSLLTKHVMHMDWLMQIIASKESLFFVDSKTTNKSIAINIAQQKDIKTTSRDIFLDHEKDPVQINRQLDKLISKARLRGTALGIGHPYPETIAVLEARLPKLKEQGIELIPVSKLIARKQQKRDKTWLVHLSP